MRVAIDARAYSWAGVGRYTRNLLGQLVKLPCQHKFVVLLGEQDRTRLEEDVGKAGLDRFEVRLIDSSYYSWREQTVFWRQLIDVRADLYHFTHFNVPLMFNRPYLVTVHDVTRFIFPGQRQRGLLRQLAYEMVFKHAVEKARAVVCVSEMTKHDLRSLPFKLPRMVETIQEGVDSDFLSVVQGEGRQRARLMLGTSDPYLLYMGVWMNHKNLPRLLKAYARVLKQHPNLKLVMTGKPRPGYVDVPRVARRLGLNSEQIIYLGFVSRDLLPALYAEAEVLLLPSLYEGFGLTALEAAACGTPVVASHVSALPEVMGKAASYVNPEYEVGIAFGIERVLSDEGLRRKLITEGKSRAGEYSWEQCARKTLGVYDKAG